MKKLNTIFSFVLLSFCLLINVSFAEFSSIPITDSAIFSPSSGYSNTFDGITSSTLRTVVKNYIADSTNSSYKDTFDATMLQLTNAGYKVVIITGTQSNSGLIYVAESNVSLGANSSSDTFDFYSTYIDSSITTNSQNLISRMSIYSTSGSSSYVNVGKDCYYQRNYPGSLFYSNTDLKLIVYNGGPTWDGTSYYYEVPSDEPDDPEIPTMPSNSEIASAVQMFYDSDYYKNATDFDKFIVLYDNTTGLYSFIGHTIPEFLQQTIIPPNYRYQGYMYDVQWWKFELSENSGAPAYGTPYYLYVIDNKLENLEYRGKSTISSLVESGPWATSNTIIVYSNYDYLVRTYVLDEETGDYVYTDGTIAGNQYTYDEDLDITDNQYNPLDNFVTVNYPSTLVGNADFDSFLNTFNENKDVLILPQNTSWVILSNIALFEHFSSFIIMCTLFIILERVMRG